MYRPISPFPGQLPFREVPDANTYLDRSFSGSKGLPRDLLITLAPFLQVAAGRHGESPVRGQHNQPLPELAISTESDSLSRPPTPHVPESEPSLPLLNANDLLAVGCESRREQVPRGLQSLDHSLRLSIPKQE